MTAGTVFLMWLGEQIDEFGIEEGLHGIFEGGAHGIEIGLAPVFPFGIRDQRAGILKSRNPAISDPHRVPAHVIRMQMSAGDRVDRLDWKARILEILQKGSL